MGRSEFNLNVDGLIYNGLKWNNSCDAGSNVVFLHGFTGSSESFDHIASNLTANCIAIDLPGHGRTQPGHDLERFSPQRVIEDLILIMDMMRISKPTVVGYSMGARLAMQLAIRHPMSISRLVLESGNPGLKEEFERKQRSEKDSILAQRITQDFSRFLKIWNRLPLFDSPLSAPKKIAQKFEEIQKSHNPAGLAASLIMNSTGRMPLLKDQLNALSLPIHSITGAMDQKYCKLWFNLKDDIRGLHHHIIPDAGHRVHLDNPLGYTNLLQTIILT
jgi:2-succinyl-6-hydroxy-2,4-cyclohexadiene-1-carboxylate synthase